MKRFDIVVFNHERLDSWFRNADRIQSFVPSLDRITIVSCSPSEKEYALVRDFEAQRGCRLRYLTRENRGYAELARIDYYTGRVGTLEENLAYEFVFQMQDHYLDTDSSFSHWGPKLGNRVKGDVVPDGTIFDLSSIYDKLNRENLAGAFCDRTNPCWFTIGSRRYIAPSGGNFIVRSSAIRDVRVYSHCQSLRRVCDDSYAWAVYVEFMWGKAFFEEGKKFYDLKRDRIFSTWDRDLFYIAPDNFPALHACYRPGIPAGLRRFATRLWTYSTSRIGIR